MNYKFIEISLFTSEAAALKKIYVFFEGMGIDQKKLVRVGVKGGYKVCFYAKTPGEVRRIEESFRQTRIPAVTFKARSLGKHDWFDKWQKDYPITRVGAKFTVVPVWRKGIYLRGKDTRTPVYLDPAGAFGSGMHETTKLVVRIMEKLPKGAQNFLDIGTGTGILAVVAFRLGVQTIEAFDSDKISVRSARRNLLHNGCRKAKVNSKNLSQLNGKTKFDWVAANLIGPLLLEYETKICAAVKPGGFLMVSGVLKKNLDDFTQKFKAPHFTRLKEVRGRSWGALLYQRR